MTLLKVNLVIQCLFSLVIKDNIAIYNYMCYNLQAKLGMIWFRQAKAWYDKHVEWLPYNQIKNK